MNIAIKIEYDFFIISDFSMLSPFGTDVAVI